MKGFSPKQMETVRPLVYFIFFIFSAVTSPRMHIRRLQCRRSSFLKVYTNCPLDKATIRCKEIYQAEKTLIIVIVEFCCYLFQIKTDLFTYSTGFLASLSSTKKIPHFSSCIHTRTRNSSVCRSCKRLKSSQISSLPSYKLAYNERKGKDKNNHRRPVMR